MNVYDSLEKALDAWFGRSFNELPNPLRRRVIADFLVANWDNLTPDERRSVAQQHDYQHDPATNDHREFWFNFYANLQDLEQEIDEWEMVAAPTASDLEKKKQSIALLKEKKAHLDRLEGIYLRRNFPRIPVDHEPTPTGTNEYLAYPAAFKLLAETLQATSGEVAAWIFMGPDEGGIRAFYKSRRQEGVARFWFEPQMEPDYESLLFNCWFLKSELEAFAPHERFISGETLKARWHGEFGGETLSFIQAKVSCGELTDIHPVKGATSAATSDSEDWPELETGLFSITEVSQVESEQGIEISDDELFISGQEDESPAERRARIQQWIDQESRLRGTRGAPIRVAAREGVSRQRIEQILKKGDDQ